LKLSISSVLPRHPGLARGQAIAPDLAQRLVRAAGSSPDEVLRELDASRAGLSEEEAARRLERFGPNSLAAAAGHPRSRLLARAFLNPLVLLLSALAAVSLATGDRRAAAVMALMVATGVALRFVQEARADSATAKLRAMLRVTATVVREGAARELPLAEIVPGDVVRLCAGDMVPADVRLLSSKDLFVVQASLTGESLPVEKADVDRSPDARSPLEFRDLCFLGTSVDSGSATALVVATGKDTYFAGIARGLAGQPPPSAFDKGVTRFTWLMIRLMLVLVPAVFAINGLTKGAWHEAFLFALAVAVGMTPEMLPMIVTVCLSKGAMAMARKKVIVKRLSSIQNVGAMDVLCTDKTGTLTLDRVVLEKHCNLVLEEDDEVLALAYLNSHFQTGLKNVLDRAVLAHVEVHEAFRVPEHRLVDEIPFDFARRLMSVVVDSPDGRRRLICKGAPEEVFARCTRFEGEDGPQPMERIVLDDLRLEHQRLSADGFRVLAIAYRDVEKRAEYSKADEADLVLRGYVAFFDPPKDTAGPALAALQRHGIAVKVLTGDNDAVSRKICREVGLAPGRVLLGAEVEALPDAELAKAVEEVVLFARLAPFHKQRVIAALQRNRHVVGFLGDGINDAPALRAADVGISVDSAADIARESADMILLEKSLLVLDEGVMEGRKVFANILKYVRMGASSSFGNMLSVVGASALLPFLPMAPLQILATNLLYDFSQLAIPVDEVDPEQIAKPRPWSVGEITRFILLIGPCSSVFDYTTFGIMWFVFQACTPAAAPLFQTGWFVESLLTQTLIIHVIRTNKVPFLQSRAAWPLAAASLAVAALGVWLPFSPLADVLGLTRLPGLYWPLLLLTLVGYVLLTQRVKSSLIRRGWI
jgi:P-type Mg2+ transporter